MTRNLIDDVVHEEQVTHHCHQEEPDVEHASQLCIDNLIDVHIDDSHEQGWLLKDPVKLGTCRAAQVENRRYPSQVETAQDEEVGWVALVQLAEA